ncbi:MAG TPA: type VI secretion system tube protein Hcp [Steroidobacteraceae bacterium]|nr:type VI secretion system tube protein Hcp [Steroidobacteraceae bacterium]
MMKRTYLGVAAAAAMSIGSAQAASDYLIQIEGIAGTSTLAGFEDYIEVESWSLGFVRNTCQDLHFVKRMDAASADLTGAAMRGTFYPKVVLVARKQGGDSNGFVYLKLTLTNSVFSSFQSGGSNGSSQLPIEQVSAQPSSVKFEAFEQGPTGLVTLVASNTVICQKVK